MATGTTPNDLKMLIELQKDCDQSLESVAEKIGVSMNTCWRRLKHMEQNKGYIDKKVMLLNPKAFGYGLTVFVMIKAGKQSSQWSEKFVSIVETIPEILELYLLTGDYDYSMKILVRNVTRYHDIYKKLTSEIEVKDISATFAMERLKYTTEVPLGDYVRGYK